ncbi:TraV family lipoprotein [Sphingomonas silueang]|uniref:TraV family lipoprotein n=1 Tax=Sphingomonas silueang TaxID=3156617 RepID=UPI0032B41F2F
MTRRSVTLLLVGGAALSGCATLGGNVKGSFACVAPEGICAPSSVIDDRALAMISGNDGDRFIQPAGPYPAPQQQDRAFLVAAGGAVRTGEKVLRIVFLSHIDAAGRLHEQSTVHAVVDTGNWRQASAGEAVATDNVKVAEVATGPTLLAALDAAEAALPAPEAGDPDLPSAAAIDAARAARPSAHVRTATADPIGAIKREVAGTLTTSPRPRALHATAQPSPTPALPVRPLSPNATVRTVGPAATPLNASALSAPRPQGSPTAATIIPA